VVTLAGWRTIPEKYSTSNPRIENKFQNFHEILLVPETERDCVGRHSIFDYLITHF